MKPTERQAAEKPSGMPAHWVCLILAVVALAAAAARIADVKAKHGRTPFLSANDRSRWSTIRALVDHGTFVLDDVIVKADGKFDKDWHTIDLVRHRGADGREHYYSSKPPLLTVLLAGECWLVQQLTGQRLADQPLYVGRIVVALTNLPLLALLWWLVYRLTREVNASDTAAILTFAMATFGTALTPFAVTLSNHLPAAVACLGTVYLVWRLATGALFSVGLYAAAGACAAMTVVGELPALSLMPAAIAALAWRSWQKTLVGFVPAAALVAACAVGTNYLAHGVWRPAYGQRGDGHVLGYLPESAAADFGQAHVSVPVRERLNQLSQLGLSAQTNIGPGEDRWIVWDEETQQRLAIVRRASGATAEAAFEVRAWKNWYDYPGSYWTTERQGVDQGEPSRAAYLFHILVGHHGLFSLTPWWCFSVWGACLFARSAERERRALAWVAAYLFFVCLAFYIARPLIDRNYGGVSCTFRWLTWQIPLWLILGLPAVDRATRSRWGWLAIIVCLAGSVFAAQYHAANPWTSPWIYAYWQHLGWIGE
jgi:hypothetical protein